MYVLPASNKIALVETVLALSVEVVIKCIFKINCNKEELGAREQYFAYCISFDINITLGILVEGVWWIS